MSFDLKITNRNISLNKGAPETVTGINKLIQDIYKLLITDVGGNAFYSWYGSYLAPSVIGHANIDPLEKQAIAQTQINNSLNMLKKLQEAQSNTYQNVSPSEQLAGVTGISINLDSNDPRKYIIKIGIIAKDFTEATLTLDGII